MCLDKTYPKGTLVNETGMALLRNGYRMKIFNTINFKKSMKYNPFAYIRSEKDILKLVNTLIANTKGDGKAGDDLMSIDELSVMDGSKCIVQIRGVRPFLSDKYDLTVHPNCHLTADADKKNWFDIEKYLNRKMKVRGDEVFEVLEVK